MSMGFATLSMTHCREMKICSQHDSLQGDEDLLKIRVRKNELQAHRVQDVGLHVFLRDSSAVCRYCPYCRGTSLHEYFNIFHWYLKE